jgi:protein gp37
MVAFQGLRTSDPLNSTASNIVGETSKIEWCDATFNPWWGCTKVSPGCDNCYAEAWAKRTGHRVWDVPDRRTFGIKHWAGPQRWNTRAQKEGKRLKVFCASMADVFDKDGPANARADLWDLIEDTPHLDWLLLTKRVGNVLKMVPQHWSVLPWNVWLGISVVNQVEADRDIPKLIEIPVRVRFLSCEPLLGPISFEGRWIDHADPAMHENWLEALSWVIVGGESGPKARPMNATWAYDLRDQCTTIGVPFFFKQWGEYKHVGYTHGAVGDDMGEGWIFDAPDPRMRPYMWKCGKKKAGRILDNRTWDEFPRSTFTSPVCASFPETK